MPEKTRRQATLLRLVRRRRIATQDELVQLINEAGFSATQASISRDLRELGLVKLAGAYAPLPALSAGRDGPETDLITSAVPAGANLLIVRTAVGAAAPVAVEIDRRAWPEVVGTVAGDDTVFVAVTGRAAQGRVLARLGGGRAAAAPVNGRPGPRPRSPRRPRAELSPAARE